MNKTAVFLIAALCFAASSALAGSVRLMEKTELREMLGSNEVVILDVRTGRDWSTSEFKIPGAIRASGENFDQWGTTYPRDQKIVLYCA